MIGAIFIGNAAYEAGNLTGALIGLKGILSMEVLTFGGNLDWFPFLLGGGVGVFLLAGSFRFLINSLVAIGQVVLMSVYWLFAHGYYDQT